MNESQAKEVFISAQYELERISDRGGPTGATETARWTELVEERDSLAEIIDRHEEQVAMIRRNADRGAVEHDPGYNINTRSNPLDNVRVDEPLAELRGRVASALGADKFFPADAAEAALRTLENVQGNRRAVALRMIATGSLEYRSAFAKVMRDERHLITDAERDSILRAQSMTDAAGGFAVPFTLDPTIIGVTDSTANPIRRIARTVQITTDSWNGVTGTAVSFTWTAEGVESADASTTLAQPTIPVYKAEGFVPFSIEIGGDWADIESDLRMLMMEGRDNIEGVAHVTGTGSAQPTGVVTALAGTGSEINESAAGTFTAADVYATQAALNTKYLDAAQWALHLGTSHDIRQFDVASGSGGNFWTSLGGGTPERLLGMPANIVNNMDDSPSVAAGNNYVLICGDWRNYVLVDRVGMQVELIPHLFGATNRFPTGQRGLYAWLRHGADSVNDSAFSLLNITV